MGDNKDAPRETNEKVSEDWGKNSGSSGTPPPDTTSQERERAAEQVREIFDRKKD